MIGSHHGSTGHEHHFSLAILLGAIDYLEARSILEIGAGTGNAMAYLKARRPALRVLGVEPARELREAAHAKGIDPQDLVSGDALDLQFETGSIDIVCAVAVLHHIQDHHQAVSEMLRVAAKAVFISDSNNFGQGGFLMRSVKQLLNAGGLWKLADWAKTRGKGYTITEGDGLVYSYSAFNDYPLLRSRCRSVHVLNTTAAGINPYRTAPDVALLGIK